MFCKKIFVLMLFIVSIQVSAANLSFEAQKIREGLNLFDSSDYKGAISLLDEISALKLNTASEYNLRGEYLVKIGEYHFDTMNYDKGKELFDLAIRDYDSAIKLAPNDVDSYINRGNFYCKHGEQDLAIKDYDKVLELAPNNVDAYIGRGNAYTNAANLAQRDLNKAIELNPNDFRAYMARSIIYLKIGQNNLALEDANKAVELNPNNSEVYNNRGLVYHNLKQYDSALQDYNKALELAPKNFKAYKGRGMVYFDMQEYARAIEELNKCIEIYPELNAVNLRRHCDYMLHKTKAEK
ncbi:MAG: tetratricopeptide repeat protein [Selenomonadaceae bacterium]|nr:tetratricopeptide repeat protein [Selenomonadaceae bacterium]